VKSGEAAAVRCHFSTEMAGAIDEMRDEFPVVFKDVEAAIILLDMPEV